MLCPLWPYGQRMHPCQRKTLNRTCGKWVFMKLTWSETHQEGLAEIFKSVVSVRGLINEFAN